MFWWTDSPSLVGRYSYTHSASPSSVSAYLKHAEDWFSVQGQGEGRDFMDCDLDLQGKMQVVLHQECVSLRCTRGDD